MSGKGVDSRRDELVALLLDPLRRVVEVRAGRRHRCAPHQLPEDHHRQADGDREDVDEARLVRGKPGRNQNFHQSGAVGRVVRYAVAEKQEAAGADLRQIVRRRRPEFEEVEETQRGCESEQAPDSVLEVGCLGSEDQGGGEGESEPEGLSADVRERAFAFGEKRGIVRVQFAGEGTLDSGVIVPVFAAVVFLRSLS